MLAKAGSEMYHSHILVVLSKRNISVQRVLADDVAQDGLDRAVADSRTGDHREGAGCHDLVNLHPDDVDAGVGAGDPHGELGVAVGVGAGIRGRGDFPVAELNQVDPGVPGKAIGRDGQGAALRRRWWR